MGTPLNLAPRPRRQEAAGGPKKVFCLNGNERNYFAYIFPTWMYVAGRVMPEGTSSKARRSLKGATVPGCCLFQMRESSTTDQGSSAAHRSGCLIRSFGYTPGGQVPPLQSPGSSWVGGTKTSQGGKADGESASTPLPHSRRHATAPGDTPPKSRQHGQTAGMARSRQWCLARPRGAKCRSTPQHFHTRHLHEPERDPPMTAAAGCAKC
jgi:hypothetical protein